MVSNDQSEIHTSTHAHNFIQESHLACLFGWNLFPFSFLLPSLPLSTSLSLNFCKWCLPFLFQLPSCSFLSSLSAWPLLTLVGKRPLDRVPEPKGNIREINQRAANPLDMAKQASSYAVQWAGANRTFLSSLPCMERWLPPCSTDCT